MGGWVPFDADSWPIVAEALAKPWPREAILFDLRWWADGAQMGRRARPGRPALRRRWGVTDWAVQQALKAESEWADPSRSNSRPTADQQPTNSAATDEPAVSAEDRQPTTSAPPADRPTRVGDHPTPITHTPPSEETDSHGPTNGHRVEWDRAHEAYLDALGTLGKRRVPVKSTSSTGRALSARIRDHGIEPIVALMRWWATSEHERARFLRDGGHGLDTLTRASKCEAYLRIIAEGGPTATGPPARAAPPTRESLAAHLIRRADPASTPLPTTPPRLLPGD